VLEAVRNLAYELRPAGLEELGLAETLVNYCQELSRETAIAIDFSAVGLDESRLSNEAKVNLYRIVQEGLSNIKRHSGADRATVRLAGSFPQAILRIEDNGRGFDVAEQMRRAVYEKRMGLRSIKERAALLGGTAKIDSRRGEGTRIIVRFPVDHSSEPTPRLTPQISPP
jgi:signal transduction histidine kinase